MGCMTEVQQRAVFALAMRLGHEWVFVAANATELDLEKIAVNTIAARVEGFPPGIASPETSGEATDWRNADKVWIVHASGSGRIHYAVDPWGKVEIEIHRPQGCVLFCSVEPSDGQFQLVTVSGRVLPYFQRHFCTLKWIVSALVPDSDLSVVEADARPDWNGWEITLKTGDDDLAENILCQLPGAKVVGYADATSIRPPGDATQERVWDAQGIVNRTCYCKYHAS